MQSATNHNPFRKPTFIEHLKFRQIGIWKYENNQIKFLNPLLLQYWAFASLEFYKLFCCRGGVLKSVQLKKIVRFYIKRETTSSEE